MQRQWTCPSGHMWLAAGDAAESLGCPQCGALGKPLGEQASRIDTILHAPDTLPPGAVPPWVEPLPTVIQERQPQTESARGELPAMVGAYEILDELARGGMGVIYRARRPGLDRVVALKMILAGGHASEEAHQRFRLEAEAIARLEHPNIIRIYDVGEHESLLYLVLEFVDGPTLFRQLGGKPLAPATAARMLEILARAMAFVHARGIVHRDLTPSNVLLSRAPREQGKSGTAIDPDAAWEQWIPKITDFGLAKRLDDEGTHTRTGVVMGTPSYMAPEQAAANKDEIGPASDIYSLGAILYELLCGRPPFIGETALATLEQVLQVEPVAPRRLQPRVPRDLETICLRSLEKDPRNRYPSADELADDLGRFLRGEPILARPVGAVQRTWRWARRRPAIAALISISVLSVILFAAGGWWSNARIVRERDRAELSFRQALKAIDEMLTQVGEKDLLLEPRMDAQRSALLHRALALYQEFLADRGDDGRLVWEIAHAQRRIGDIERWLGEFPQARGAYSSALVLLSQANDGEVPEAERRRWQAYCQNYLGEACRLSGDAAGARQAYLEAIRLGQTLQAEFPIDSMYAQDLARGQYNLGILARANGQLPEAEAAMTSALEVLQPLHARRPEDVAVSQELARVRLNLGQVARSLGNPASAVQHSTEAIELLQTLVSGPADRPEYRLELAVAHANRGNAEANLAERDKAVADYERAVTILTTLIAAHPEVPTLRQELANTRNSFAAVHAAAGDLPGAQREWTEVVSLQRGLVEQFPDVPAYRGDLGITLGNLAGAESGQGHFEVALQRLHEGLELLDQALQSNPREPDYSRSLVGQLRELGRVSIELNDMPAALAAARRLEANELSSPDDRLAAACLLIRAAVKIDERAAGAPSQGPAESDALCVEAAEWIRTTPTLNQVDAPLREFARDLLAGQIERFPSLAEAHARLVAPKDIAAEGNQ